MGIIKLKKLFKCALPLGLLTCRSQTLPPPVNEVKPTPPPLTQLSLWHDMLSHQEGPAYLPGTENQLEGFPRSRAYIKDFRRSVEKLSGPVYGARIFYFSRLVDGERYQILRQRLQEEALTPRPRGEGCQHSLATDMQGFDAALSYEQQVLAALLTAPFVSWVPEYTAQQRQSSDGAWVSGISKSFDEPLLFSFHWLVGKNSPISQPQCGQAGQPRSCDGHHSSPFFHPAFRLLPCEPGNRWRPDASRWPGLLSPQMRRSGLHILPAPSSQHLNDWLPSDYKQKFPGSTCRSPIVSDYELDRRYSLAARLTDWAGFKDSLPEYTVTAIQQFRKGQDQDVSAAYFLRSSVEQIQSQIFGRRWKPGVLKQDLSCQGCTVETVRENDLASGLEWDMERRTSCPSQCLIQASGQPWNHAASSFIAASDRSEYPEGLLKKIQRYFDELRGGHRLSQDPVSLAAEVLQAFLRHAPFQSGNELTGWLVSEMILHGAGLPFPMLASRFAFMISEDPAEEFHRGLSKHIEVQRACQEFRSCVAEKLGSEASFCGTNLPPEALSCRGSLQPVGWNLALDPCDCAGWQTIPRPVRRAALCRIERSP